MLSLLVVLLLGALLFILPELLRRHPDHYEYPDIPAESATPPTPAPDERTRPSMLSTAAPKHTAAAAVVPLPVETPEGVHGKTPPDLAPLVNGFIMAEILSPPLVKRYSPIPYRRNRW